MSGHIQASYMQNMAKLYARLIKDAEDEDDWDMVNSPAVMGFVYFRHGKMTYFRFRYRFRYRFRIITVFVLRM